MYHNDNSFDFDPSEYQEENSLSDYINYDTRKEIIFFDFEKEFSRNQDFNIKKDIDNTDIINKTSFTTLKQPEIENIIIDNKEINKKENIRKGRKKKNEERNTKNNKFRKDNEMKKIKAYLINFIFDNLNSRLTFSHKKFLKINKNVNENLEREFNINLMNMTIKEIFEKFSVNNKYSKSIKRKNLNQELIMEIYEKNKENKVIELLNSKYIDQLKNLRNNYLDKFVRDMHEKSKNNNDNDLEKYINELKQLLFDYEFWFENKKPRVKRRKENI